MSTDAHDPPDAPRGPRGPAAPLLVVDDDRLVLATLVHGLQQAGYDVIDADNGDDAILLARRHRPRLALLDIRMQGMSGFDVAAYLREWLGVPFMFLSAFADDDTRARVRELGAVDYLVKPLDIGRLLPAVARALASSAGGAPSPSPASSEAPRTAAPDAVAPGATTPDATTPDAAVLDAAVLDATALAVGVLMHRFSLGRDAALRRLVRLADERGESCAAAALRVVQAVEVLGAAGP